MPYKHRLRYIAYRGSPHSCLSLHLSCSLRLPPLESAPNSLCG